MFGGRGANGRFYNDVWTYDPAAGAWTQRSQTFTNPPETGFTLSGTISNGSLSDSAQLTVEVSGRSGWSQRQVLSTVNGAASYQVTGIPPGDTVTLTLLDEDMALAYPLREWSFINLGEIARNVSADLTLSFVLPLGPLGTTLLTTAGTYQ